MVRVFLLQYRCMPPLENKTANKNIPPVPPAPSPQQTDTQQPLPAPEKKVVIKSLRTYQGDIQEAMAGAKTSISSIVVAEQQRKERILSMPQEKVHADRRNGVFSFLGVLLVLVGVGAVGYVYYTKPKEDVVVQPQKTKAMIAYTEEKPILVTLGSDDFIGKITATIATAKLSAGSIIFINTINGDNEAEKIGGILLRAAPQIPPSLLRAVSEPYMFGVYSSAVSSSPFLLVSNTDFAATYAGMLKWEETMSDDLGKIFGISGRLGTTTKKFIDEELKNKDMRLLKDTLGQTALLYSFLDKNTLLITTNEKAFEGVLSKYLISKTIR